MQSEYQQTLDYLYAKLPMFSRTGKAALKPGLDNTLALLNALGNPHQKFRSVHIAGTNGKGSVSHGLAAILQDAGYKTGLYTSPHLIDLRERIRVNGAEVSREWIVSFVARVMPLIDSIQPSFFEIMVAAAFVYFAEEAVDVAVIETGLGGRLDSTNVITPLLSVITNIGLDHTDLLGDTIEKIAVEKAGIIKFNVPVVIGKTQPETEGLFRETAQALGSQIVFADRQYHIERENGIDHEAVYGIENILTGDRHTCSSDLCGAYQQENIATILMAADVLAAEGLTIPLETRLLSLKRIAQTTGLRGRYEVLRTHPLVVADVAHNKDGLEPVLKQFLETAASRRRIVAGFVRDKDVAAALALFPGDADYYWCNADLPRALPATRLAEMGGHAGLNGTAYGSVHEAVQAALTDSGADDALLITGSFFIVGEALQALEQ